MAEQRALEARKLGFTACILPESAKSALTEIKGIQLIGVKTVKDAIGLLG